MLDTSQSILVEIVQETKLNGLTKNEFMKRIHSKENIKGLPGKQYLWFFVLIGCNNTFQRPCVSKYAITS